MKGFLRAFCTIIAVFIIVALTAFLIFKIKDDTLNEKNKDLDMQNTQAEAEYITTNANNAIEKIKSDIQNSINGTIEVADVGSINYMDIYFVTKSEGEYKYIVKTGNSKYEIAKDNAEEAKYIVPLSTLGFDECIFTKVEDYHIDKDAVITYVDSK